MNENEITAMRARILELESVNAAYLHEISRLDSMNLFLRSIIEKMIENGKN